MRSTRSRRRLKMSLNHREFEMARERDLDRAVEEHYGGEDEEYGKDVN